jgi:hypothetical protein
MRWLDTQEFSEYEKCCAGTESWPNWHWPVMLLYGGHIALNQVNKTEQFFTINVYIQWALHNVHTNRTLKLRCLF